MGRPSKPLTAALTAAGLCAALLSCTTTGTPPPGDRPADPGYDAQHHLAAQYRDIPECQPRILPDPLLATVLAEPAACPLAWDRPEPTPCPQIELSDGTRQPVAEGIIGLSAAGSPPRRVVLGRLEYPDLDHCLPTDVTPAGLIYLRAG